MDEETGYGPNIISIISFVCFTFLQNREIFSWTKRAPSYWLTFSKTQYSMRLALLHKLPERPLCACALDFLPSLVAFSSPTHAPAATTGSVWTKQTHYGWPQVWSELFETYVFSSRQWAYEPLFCQI
jgi:hypothetical protein